MTPSRRQHLGRRICSDLDGMPAAKQDAVLYFVICQFKDGRAVVERDVTRMNREATLNDLRSGELCDVVSIIETEFTDQGLSSRDVTATMLMEAELMREPMPPSDRLAALHDRAQDERKNWVAS